MSVAVNGLDLVLFFILHKVQWWPQVVLAMFYCFNEWGKEGCVEHWMYGPLMGEGQFVCHWGHHLSDQEGPMTSRGQLDQPIG